MPYHVLALVAVMVGLVAAVAIGAFIHAHRDLKTVTGERDAIAGQLDRARIRARVDSARVQELRRRCDGYLTDLDAVTEATRPPVAAQAALTPDDPVLDIAAAHQHSLDLATEWTAFVNSLPVADKEPPC
ncbi:hypothetical protein [Polymorphospora rubra]|nr:hypothetical protein [Polymorphospora rubra]